VRKKYFRAARLAAHSRNATDCIQSRIGDFNISRLFLYTGCAATMAATFRVSKIFWIKNFSNPLYFNIFKLFFLFLTFNNYVKNFSFSKFDWECCSTTALLDEPPLGITIHHTFIV